MIFLPTNPLHYNARVYFRNQVMDSLPNNETDWYNGYRSWLAEQGCVIVKNKDRNFVVDILGVAPGYDRFGFNSEKDAMLFILRWA